MADKEINPMRWDYIELIDEYIINNLNINPYE